jgi:hypothetical protein
MTTFDMAPMDTPMRASTWAALAVLAGCCALLLWSSARPGIPPGTRAVLVVGALVVAGIGAAAYAFAPRALQVDGGTLVIDRMVRPIRIAAREARLLSPDQLRGSLRTFGVGGLFGSYGMFRNRELGAYRKYATRTRDFVIVATDGSPVVVTPADPEAFVRALR